MTFHDLENGISIYVNQEFCRKLDDWRKWAMPLMVGMFTKNLRSMFESNIDMLKSAGVVLDNGCIQLDMLYNQLSQISRDTGNITCQVPLIGQVTFSTVDVDALYRILKSNEVSVTTNGVQPVVGSV